MKGKKIMNCENSREMTETDKMSVWGPLAATDGTVMAQTATAGESALASDSCSFTFFNV